MASLSLPRLPVAAAALQALLLLLLLAAAKPAAAKECTNIPTQLGLLGAGGDGNGGRGRMLGSGGQAFLADVPLADVRLAAGSPQAVGQATNLAYLLLLDVDRLVWSFRTTAGLPAPGSPYSGWEAPASELRGHFVGHYLSATALMWASTNATVLKQKMEALVAALKECQDKIGTGYLSAFPTELFDRVEAIQPVWAPYYTIHKIMAGLVDQYELAGSELALQMATRMADYFRVRVEAVIERFTIERHWRSLNEEFGGMNDVLYRLYHITDNSAYLKLAHLFDKPCFLGPLALEVDELAGYHSNTHIPIIVGVQLRYELTGDEVYKNIAENFMHAVNTSHRYTTGGTSAWEFWQALLFPCGDMKYKEDPHRLGDTLQQEDQESCTTYNMLKVSRNLFRWTRDASFAEFYERNVINGIMGTQRGTEPGKMIYMLPLGAGNSKARGYHGWGNPFDSFWCCYGSGRLIALALSPNCYFQQPSYVLLNVVCTAHGSLDSPTLYIIQYVSSTLQWRQAGLRVEQTVLLPTATSAAYAVTLNISKLEGREQTAGNLTADVNVRIPLWADLGTSYAQLDGEELQLPSAGSFLNVQRDWVSGGVLKLNISLTVRTEGIQDDRPAFSSLQSILFGPFLLAGLTDSDRQLVHPLNLSPVPSDANSNLISLVTHDGRSHLRRSGRHLISSPGTPLEGTDEAAAATIRLHWEVEQPQLPVRVQGGRRKLQCQQGLYSTRPEFRRVDLDLEDGVGASHARLLGKLVSLELFDRPGQFAVHQGAWRPLLVMDPARATQYRNDQPLVQRSWLLRSLWGLMTSVGRKRVAPLLVAGPAEVTPKDRTTFQIVPGLSGSATVSFAVIGVPDHYLSIVDTMGSHSGSAHEESHTMLGLLGGPQGGQSDEAFANASSFRLSAAPFARYPDRSFVVQGSYRDFLLFPIADFRDESYTTYFKLP
eukprot:SM000023S07603  [mRNA]  locus=s23:424801:429936:+ [translate_table: standard]